jgi:hypothetical protein
VAGQPATALAHPGLELGDQRRDVPLSGGQARRGGQAVDGALGVEDGIDPAHRLDGERRARQLGQLEQLAPAMDHPNAIEGLRFTASVLFVSRLAAPRQRQRPSPG